MRARWSASLFTDQIWLCGSMYSGFPLMKPKLLQHGSILQNTSFNGGVQSNKQGSSWGSSLANFIWHPFFLKNVDVQAALNTTGKQGSSFCLMFFHLKIVLLLNWVYCKHHKKDPNVMSEMSELKSNLISWWGSNCQIQVCRKTTLLPIIDF
jgi:hypothetical protein